MKNLVGKKMKGFRFDDDGALTYNTEMNKCINQFGTILIKNEYKVAVSFEGKKWWYPLDKAIEHIIEDEMELIPELKGVEMEVSDYPNFIPLFIRNVYGKLNGEYLTNSSTEDVFIKYKYARPKNVKIKITKQQIAEKFNVDIEKLDIEL